MAAYPSTWAVGDVVGRNLVPRPSFEDHATGSTADTNVAPWSSGEIADRSSSTGTRGRLGGFFDTSIKLGAEFG